MVSLLSPDPGAPPFWRGPCRDAGQEEHQMANRITEDCINCGACEPECPNQAIFQGEDYFEVDAGKCDECAAKAGVHSCKPVCPVDCIVQA
jgi:ferredoxin